MLEETTTESIVQADALEWLRGYAAPADCSIVTSLPDVSELPELDLAGWRAWFLDTAATLIRWLPESGTAIFYQSDIRHHGVWVDKSHLVQAALERERACLIWHKIVCRHAPGTVSWGRPSYSHLLCVAKRAASDERVQRAGADVLPDAGATSWSRGMGSVACEVACRYLRDATATRLVLDPFCGRGSVLAVAKRFGFEVLGVNVSAKRCRAARAALRAVG